MTNTQTGGTSRTHLLRIVLIAMMTALTAVCSWISIPMVVPFTLQTFAVFAAIELLGGRDACASILCYIALGAVGVPVFAKFGAGLGVLLGPTGGYIIGFLFTALICWLFESLWGRKLPVRIAGLVLGLLVCYAFGTSWFMIVCSNAGKPYTLGAALMLCVVPFLFWDGIKMALAILVGGRLRAALPFLEKN